jgi:magnesium chelatase subunit D
MTAAPQPRHPAWSDAVLAASVLALDPPALGGIRVRARAGPVLDRWLDHLQSLLPAGAPARRIAAGISEARLTGGLDVGLTLDRGSPCVETGVLAATDGGVVILAMAERLSTAGAGILAATLDDGFVRIERDGLSQRQAARFALVALDEGIDDEGLAPALGDRLALRIELGAIAMRDADVPEVAGLDAARARLPAVAMPDDLRLALVEAAAATGCGSMRPALALCRVARCLAALDGKPCVGAAEAVAALRLVLGIHVAPPAEDEPAEQTEPAQDDPPETPEPGEGPSGREALTDLLVAAAKAAVPEDVLAGLDEGRRRGHRGTAGRSGATRQAPTRGRAVGVTERPPNPGARLDVLATLRAAAPWQKLRRATSHGGRSPAFAKRSPLLVRMQDFRYVRYEENTGTVALFAVDASGSAAVERLAETKGAIELLLAQCYVRRDSVAMIAFRGAGAEVLLEPTRSLVRAKRQLCALPGGGGTPLAAGVMATLAMAQASARRGQEVVAIFLTDGRGNVALDGSTARETVAEDMRRAVGRFRAAGLRSILIDTARRPQPRAETLARDLGSRYLALPHAGAEAIAGEIGGQLGR